MFRWSYPTKRNGIVSDIIAAVICFSAQSWTKRSFYHVILIKAFKEYYYLSLSYIALPHTRAQQSNSCLTNKATNRVLFGIKKKSFLSFCYETFYLWVLWQESFIFISVVHNKKIKIRNKDLYPFNTEEHSATVGLLLKF